MSNYTEEIHYLENECMYWLSQADKELAEHGGHCKEEAICIQKAANARSQMMKISTGSEREYQSRKVQELNARLTDSIMAFDPDYFARSKAKKADTAAGAGSAAEAGNTGTPVKASGKTDRSVDPEEIKGWYRKIPSQTFEDVNGMDVVKEKLRSCISDSRLEAVKEYLGLSKQRSYLFSGPPGCGKTFITGAFAHELAGENYKYLSLESSQILSRYVGEAEMIVSTLFAEALKNAPCVIFIDELDGVCKDRAGDIPEYASSLTTAFLTGYNSISDEDAPVIFIGATNYLDQVDKAMRDRCEVIEIPYPDRNARVAKFCSELKMLHPIDGFSFDEIGEMTENMVFNYRDIERLCEQIKILVMKKSMEKYNTEDVAIAALRSGEFGIDRALFSEALQISPPSDKSRY